MNGGADSIKEGGKSIDREQDWVFKNEGYRNQELMVGEMKLFHLNGEFLQTLGQVILD